MKNYHTPIPTVKRRELVIGLLLIPAHMFFIPFSIGLFESAVLMPVFYTILGMGMLTLLSYLCSFFLVLFLLNNLLKNAFFSFVENFWRNLQTIILGYLLFCGINYLMSLFLWQFIDPANPNQAGLDTLIRNKSGLVMAFSVLLAPIVEETLFRGIIFGSLRKKSRVLAYAVTFLAFSFYHLWDGFIFDFEPSLFLALFQYLSSSIALAWCYEKSGSLWTPIFVHMLSNFISISVSVVG